MGKTEILLNGESDRFELIEPIMFLKVGTLLTVMIIKIKDDRVEWFYESDDTDGSARIRTSFLCSEIVSGFPNNIVNQYFKEDDREGGRLYYLSEFTPTKN